MEKCGVFFFVCCCTCRFLNQGDTKKHLEHLREENTQWLDRLKEDKEKLQAHFEDMKYSGEAKMSKSVLLFISVLMVDCECSRSDTNNLLCLFVCLCVCVCVCSGQRMLEEFQEHLEEAKNK